MVKKGFYFPGQGSQYVGMGKKMCEEFKYVSDIFDEAGEALSENIQKLCFEGDIAKLTMTKNTQPALVTMAKAMYEVCVREVGITPNIAAGHSIGEISALTCVGAINFSDAVKIARIRGEFMQQAVQSGDGRMCAVRGRDIKHIEEVVRNISDNDDGTVCVSNYNSNVQTVISGNVSAVEKAAEIFESEGCKVVHLNVSAPFHSPLMNPAAEKLRTELEKYTFNDFDVPVISNVDALPYKGKEEIIDKLANQLVMPVRWVESMVYMKRYMVNYGVELGPGNTLSKMMKNNISDIRIYSMDDESDIKKLKRCVEKSYLPFLSRCLGIAVATKNSNFNKEEYESGVIASYNKISEMSKTVENEGRKAALEEMELAIKLLIKIMQTKGISNEEQKQRLDDLFYDTNTVDLFVK